VKVCQGRRGAERESVCVRECARERVCKSDSVQEMSVCT